MVDNKQCPVSDFEISGIELEASLPNQYSSTVEPCSEDCDTKFTIEEDCSRCKPEQYCCIEINNVCINFGKAKIIEDVSLKIYRNAVTAIIGPSGCGKSSFLCGINKLTDLFPNCQVNGSVKFEWDHSIYTQKASLLRRHVGMLFQKPNPFPFSIRKNLEFPLREHGISDPYEISVKVEKALSDVGLWDEVKDRVDESALSLSGGQQQRLCLARALILEPSVLLMDEPCSALDPMATKKIESLIQELSQTMTVILVTHNLSQAKRVADHVALFWKTENIGRLIEYGSVDDFFGQPKHELTKTYLEFG